MSKLLLRCLLSLLLVLPAVGGSGVAVAAIDPAVVPPRDPAPNDRSQYRRFVLPNGMKVLLLSDPKLNVSSVSVAVGVGSLSDPPERPGLAHYLEHMLFLGTDKYPAVEDFDDYLGRSGGMNNAYTADDRTNYHLEVPPAAFTGALDRFAQFFIAPKFTPQFNEREVNAVNAEFLKNLENDEWREQALRTSVYREGHPARHFGSGNLETLKGTTREELLAFHRRYYSANRMTLAMAAPSSLDELEGWARSYFGPVPNQQREELRYPPDYLPRTPALRVLRMEPIKDLRRMTLSFAMPDLRDDVGSKPAELVAFVLGHEGPGSLLALLKSQGLAVGLSVGAEAATPDYGSFDMQLSLTPEGLAQYERVLALVFAAIEQLRVQGVPAHVFDERRTMAQLDERYRDKGEGAGLAVALANLAMDYPLAIAERVPYLWLKNDPAAVRRVLDRLTRDNLLVTLVAKGLPTDRTERWFGARYSYVESNGPAWEALASPTIPTALKLPPPNPFVPRSDEVLPIAPARLIDEPGLSLYYAQDVEFQRPQVSHLARFRLPRAMASLQTATLLRFYEGCVREAVNETTYVAGEAGLGFEFGASLDGGVQFGLGGYDANATRLLDAVLPALRDCKLPPQRFEALKDRLLRELSAFPLGDAYATVTESRRRLVREFHWRPDEMLPVARGVTLAQVQAFARTLYARGKLEMLSHGNLDAPAARAIARKLAAALGHAPLAESELLRRRLLTAEPPVALRSSETLQVNNSAYRSEWMLPGDTPEVRAATMALSAFLGPPVYSELRTQQQLGYLVSGGAGDEQRTHFVVFIVQSGDYGADEVEARALALMRRLPSDLRALPAEQWQALVAGVRAKLEEKDKTIAERARRLFELAYEFGGEWGRRDATLAALDALTQPRAAELLAQAFDAKALRSITMLGFARNHAPKSPPAVSLGDAQAWKKAQRYR